MAVAGHALLPAPDVELALRAKGLLSSAKPASRCRLDEETRGKFAEMRYLEGSVGPTAPPGAAAVPEAWGARTCGSSRCLNS
jgi:hypothetical protein